MKRTLISILAAIFFTGCQVTGIDSEVNLQSQSNNDFYASIESSSTKVYLDEDLKAHWTEDDEISIFTTTFNQRFKFAGQTGDTEGGFTELSSPFFSGSAIPTLFAVYPYKESTKLSSDGILTIDLPAIQDYAINSYGLGSNTMVAVTESTASHTFCFKNICGYLVIKLYGEGVVKSISFTGNNDEHLAGTAIVTASYNQPPTYQLNDDAVRTLILDCGAGVELENDVNKAKAFWLAIPPQVFSNGFTIEITGPAGNSVVKTTNQARAIQRRVKNAMAPLEVSLTPPEEEKIVFVDPSFKAYCVENFDINKDGEVSLKEAENVTIIDCSNKHTIVSIDEIRFFTNLEELDCSANQLTSLNLDSNYKLKKLNCNNNLLKALDLSNNVELLELHCCTNDIESLNIKNNTNLHQVECYFNRIATLDLTGNPLLAVLLCNDNQIESLDFSANSQLDRVDCYNNRIEGINLAVCSKLSSLDCRNNKLTALNLNKVVSLHTLKCSDNLLTTIDLSGNRELSTLWIDHNSLTSLDLSHNSKLGMLWAAANNLTNVTFGEISELLYINLPENHLETLALSNFTKLKTLNCPNNLINSIDLNNNAGLSVLLLDNNQLQTLDLSNNSNLEHVSTKGNQNLLEIWLKINQSISNLSIDDDITLLKYKGIIYFQDNNFESYCLSAFDTNGDHRLTGEEAALINHISCPDKSITNVDEIKYFTSLETIDVSNNAISSIDVSANHRLQSLDISTTDITSLDFRGNKNLRIANMMNCNNLSMVSFGEYTKTTIPSMLLNKAVTITYSSGSANKALNDYGYPMLLVQGYDAVLAMAMVDLVGWGLPCPIEGLKIPSYEEAQQFASHYEDYHQLLLIAGLDGLETVEYMTSTLTGNYYYHQHAHTSGRTTTYINYSIEEIYFFTLKGEYSKAYKLCQQSRDSCPYKYDLHKTGIIAL